MEKILLLLKQEYQSAGLQPWVVAFSGGKDSTLVLDLVVNMLLSLDPGQRTRQVFVIANDTLVESPLVIDHLERELQKIKAFAETSGLPLQAVKTTPLLGETFWVNMIGKGYPPPSRIFRWCTEKLKIHPTTHFIRRQIMRMGEVVLLLGTRSAESTARATSIERHTTSHYYGRHTTLPRCVTFMPIRDLEDDEVWEYLATHPCPWGDDYQALVKLYREASGGECPLMVDDSHLRQPSCGERSPRFGCWTCTLVRKDRSLEGLVESGHEALLPYIRFRRWLIDFAADPRNRLPFNRKCEVREKNGKIVPGPFTLKARRMILEELRKLERQVGKSLISEEELEVIEEIWRDDAALYKFIGDDTVSILTERMLASA